MNPFSDLSQIPTVSDAPEETPEDLMRQQMMQRLGVAMNPQAAAQTAAAQRLGQGGSGAKGWLERILGGAAEGLRYSQDPKYRGVYQEELGRAQEQEKNMLPYARQLEASSAQRYKARMDAQEKERATAAKVFATLKQDAQMKVKNQNDRAKIDQDIAKSEAQIADLQTKGKFTEARTELQKLQNKLFEKIGRTQATNAASDAAVLQGVDKFTDMTGAQAKAGMVDTSLAKAAGPAVLKMLGAQGGPQTRTTQNVQLVRRINDLGEEEMIPIPKVSTSTTSGRGGGSMSPGIAKALGLSDRMGSEPMQETAPMQAAPAQTPASILGAEKPKPRPVAPALGLSGPQILEKKPPEIKPYKPIKLGWSSNAARTENKDRLQVINMASTVRHDIGKHVASIADKMGMLQGDPTVDKLKKWGMAMGAMPEFEPIVTTLRANVIQARTLERLLMTGKQMNVTEMEEIGQYMPDMKDTVQQALLKATRREVLTKLVQESLERNHREPFPPGRATMLTHKILALYKKAYLEKDKKERAERIKEIEKLTDSKNMWRLMTGKNTEAVLKTSPEEL